MIRRDARLVAGPYAGLFLVAEEDESGSIIALICEGEPGALVTVGDIWFADESELELGVTEGDWGVEWLLRGTLGDPREHSSGCLDQGGVPERAVISPIQLPEMRLQVISALESLSEPSRQVRWGQVEEGVNYYDDLTLNVHILYDDCMVLPEPGGVVPSVLLAEEVPAFLELERHLGPMISDLGDLPDADYLSDSRWPGVIQAAGAALAAMEACDEASP